ncbi:hypothetical protein [Polaribacter aestuariivivens]|uniref:hypothetical protein n=1 Tax=Polaribacter aestuariivivens TaxID=2304626 RepID=UPI003F4990E7
MLGVLLGLYLNGYYENKTLIEAKEKALEQVLNEVSENEEILTSYNAALKNKFNPMMYLFSKLNEDGEILVHKNSIKIFKENSKNIISIENIQEKSADFYQIYGTFDFYLDSPLLFKGLSNVTWQSYKQTNYLSITNFRCLIDFEGLYELQQEVNKLNYNWRETFVNENFFENIVSRNKLAKQMRNLIIKQNLLLDLYKYRENVLKNCD